VYRYAMVSIRMALLTMLALGLVYPLLMTGAAQVAFPEAANGSLVSAGGSVVGSKLIGQRFTSARYFHGRPSAAGEGYDALSSGASNLAPTSRALVERVRTGVAEAVATEPGLTLGSVPGDMVTASGSGLDPDISLANAYAQVGRIALSRGMTSEAVRRMVDAGITGQQLGVLGERRVNVLALNLRLDSTK
jgi:K+-transporting ATPase ATPase C chain